MRKFVALSALSTVTATGVHNAALDKVVEMIRSMKAQAEKDMQTEEVQHTEHQTWCDGALTEKGQKLKRENDNIKAQQAAIMEAQANQEAAQEKISKSSATIAAHKGDISAATKQRSDENTAYISEKTDLTDSIYAVDKAIAALDAVPEQAASASFLQMQQSLSVRKMRSPKLQSLLETVKAAENPFVSASERRSDVVINMMKELKTEFEDNLNQINKDEESANHAFELKRTALKQEIADNERTVDSQTKINADEQAAEGSAKEEESISKNVAKSCKKFIKNTQKACKDSLDEFTERRASRVAEQTALTQAIDILTSDKMSTGTGHLDNAQKVGSFIQLASKSPMSTAATDKVVSYLRTRGASLHSNVLMQLAEVAAAGADPFVKVKNLINQLIERLQAEAQNDLEKKGWCDKNIAANTAKIEEYTTSVEKDKSDVEAYTASVAKADADSKEAASTIAKTTKELNEATKTRNEEKGHNEKVISESQSALESVQSAMGVLQNYYSKSFLQTQEPDEFAERDMGLGGEYKGVGGEGGVMGLLETIESNFDSLISETQTIEGQAASDFDEFRNTSEQTIKSSKMAKNKHDKKKAEDQENLLNAKESLTANSKSLDDYNKEKVEVITPKCTVKTVSFEERQAKREEEIQSLQEALEILGQME